MRTFKKEVLNLSGPPLPFRESALFLIYLAILACFLPRISSAGPNSEVEIQVAALSPPCGLNTGNAIELSVNASNMSDVRQIKFEFSWAPPDAIASAFGSLGSTTESEAFIAPGPPQLEGNRAEWGMAIFGDQGLVGEGSLAQVGFEIAAGIDPTTPIDIHLDVVSLGPSYTERDTIRPIQAVVLGNYCDDGGQALSRGIFLRPTSKDLLFSPSNSGQIADQSVGEALITTRLLDAGRFSVSEIFTWTIDNLGPGSVYALLGEEIRLIEAQTSEQILSSSDQRGNAHLLLDAESGASAQETTVALEVCSDSANLCTHGQVRWQSPITAVLTQTDALPNALTLDPNYPNPFNSSTTIPFNIPPGDSRFAQLAIFDLAGQKVATPFTSNALPGRHAIHWDGRTGAGHPVASGIYIYRLRSDQQEEHRAMLLLR